MFSYYPYAAAFASEPGTPVQVDGGLVGIALVVAPFVFVTTALASRNPDLGRAVLRAMALFLMLGLGVGLVAPVLGATAGFGVGGALTLKPPSDIPDVLRWRLALTAVGVIYTFALLVFVTPAGVFTGGIVPLLLLGFADEFAAWRSSRSPVS